MLYVGMAASHLLWSDLGVDQLVDHRLRETHVSQEIGRQGLIILQYVLHLHPSTWRGTVHTHTHAHTHTHTHTHRNTNTYTPSE